MPDASVLHWLIRRETVIALAVVGGILALASSILTSRRAPVAAATWCNRAAYAFMAASILLFILAGLTHP